MEEIKLNTRRTLADDPQYFGAYLNMARHNVFLIVNHIAEKFKDLGFTALENDEDIADAEKNILLKVFDENYEHHNDYRDGVFQYMKRFIPFIKVFNPEDWPRSKKKEEQEKAEDPDLKNIDFKRLQNFLSICFKELVHLRNAYTHSYAFNNDTSDDVSRKITLDENLKDDFLLMFNLARSYSYYNFESTQEGVEDTHSEEDFEHLKNYLLFEVISNNLTPQGLFFFTCLFLEKPYAIKFLKRFNGYKNETTAPFRATLKAFTAYSIKLPHEKLLSDDPKQSLLMDMLNELNKCPKELLNHLTKEDKEKFDSKLDESARTNIILNQDFGDIDEEQLDDIIKEITSKKRSSDRFPYFALRFFDETEAMNKIRFHIGLGKLLVKKYMKSILGTETNRKILKEANAFGRISDFQIEEDVLTGINKIRDDGMHFEQFVTHYNIENNKIGIYVSENSVYPILPRLNSDGKVSNPVPAAFLSIHELPKLMLLELLNPGEAQELIIKCIETFQTALYNSDNLKVIRNNTIYDPETFTRRMDGQPNIRNKKKLEMENRKKNEYSDFLKSRRAVLDNLLDKNIRAVQLPARMQDFLMNMEDASQQKRVHHKVKLWKNDVKNRLRDLKNERIPKKGEMATYLARDIIAMIVDENVKQKITSVYYDKLQNRIAYFGLHKEEVIALCEELHIFQKDVGHIFLNKELIDTKRDILGFYRSYLEAKQKWIENTLTKTERGKTVFSIPDNQPVPYTLKKFKSAFFDFEKWLAQKAAKPIDLPTNLFDDKLTEILKEKLKTKGIKTAPEARFAFLLNEYVNHDSQPFYNYKRKYYIGKEEREFDVNGLTAKDLKNKCGKWAETNEKLIRFTLTKDRMVKFMCEKLIGEDPTLQLSDAIFLRNIYPGSEINPLDSPVVFKQSLHGKTIIAKNNEETRQKVEQWKSMTYEEKSASQEPKAGYTWTVKDFGTFKRFLTDRRLPELLKYFELQEIPYSILEHELKEYDRYREKIFDTIFDIEKKIIEKDKEGLKALAANKRWDEVQFGVYINWLKQYEISFDEQFLRAIRNSFSHSQFPRQNVMRIPGITQNVQEDFDLNHEAKGYKENYRSLSKQIYEQYDQEISRILHEIEAL